MATSRRAFVKENQSVSDPNDQWIPIQFAGTERIDDWAGTIATIPANPDHVPLQWTTDLGTVSASELPTWADLEAPVTHYIIARKGLRNGNNPNVWDALLIRDSQEKITASFTKYAAKYPSIIYVIFATDRFVDLTGRLTGQQQGAGR